MLSMSMNYAKIIPVILSFPVHCCFCWIFKEMASQDNIKLACVIRKNSVTKLPTQPLSELSLSFKQRPIIIWVSLIDLSSHQALLPTIGGFLFIAHSEVNTSFLKRALECQIRMLFMHRAQQWEQGAASPVFPWFPQGILNRSLHLTRHLNILILLLICFVDFMGRGREKERKT